jgi:hypothetical protein
MRTLIAFAVAVMFPSIAVADQTEGKIKSIDKDNSVITLEDGKDYKLPGEFDVESLKEGMDILLAYDEIKGENLITDMQLPE